jgi:branched-subunit amino acid aminotransferase/4-amino-4-deoxychorismate lyase
MARDLRQRQSVQKGAGVKILKNTVSVTDERFFFGVALAENMRMSGGKLKYLSAHLQRLAEGCRALGWPPPELVAIRNACQKKAASGSLRLRYWGLSDPALLLQILPAVPKQRGPLRLMTSVVRHYGAASLQGRLKSNAMLPNWLAKAETQIWAEDGLRLTPDGLVAEGVWSNIVVRKGRIVRTPPLGQGVLEGVTRAQLLIRLARQYKVIEQPLTRYDLWTADEVWVCSSLRGPLKVSEVDGRKID